MILQEKDLEDNADQIAQVWYQFELTGQFKIGCQVWHQIGSQIRRKIGFQVWNNIDEQFEKQIDKSYDT